jgi:hypothetical protein
MQSKKRPKKEVGRPKKYTRDAAVFIARWWRVECLGETVSNANIWVLQHWQEHTSKGEKVGITDPAHIRAAIRRSSQTWLGDVRFALNDSFAFKPSTPERILVLDPGRAVWVNWVAGESLPAGFSDDACVIAAIERAPFGDRARCALWAPGMTEATVGRAVQLSE